MRRPLGQEGDKHWEDEEGTGDVVLTLPGRAPTHALLVPSPPPPSANVSQVLLVQLRHVPAHCHKDPKPYLSLLPISSTTSPLCSPKRWTFREQSILPGGIRLWQVTSFCSSQCISIRRCCQHGCGSGLDAHKHFPLAARVGCVCGYVCVCVCTPANVPLAVTITNL